MGTIQNKFPKGWNEKRTKTLIAHYEKQTAAEAAVEDDAAFAKRTHTVMKVPLKLVPQFRAMIAKGS